MFSETTTCATSGSMSRDVVLGREHLFSEYPGFAVAIVCAFGGRFRFDRLGTSALFGAGGLQRWAWRIGVR